MTNRAIFNRRFTSFTADGTQVWLVNGSSVTTSPVTTVDFIAGQNLIQGETVFVSGTVVLAATAASGIDSTNYNAIGITSEAASVSASVKVILDDVAVLSSANLINETALTPGQYYYVSNEAGKLTAAAAPSGITLTGGYAALAPIGIALTSSELSVEIAPVTVLTE